MMFHALQRKDAEYVNAIQNNIYFSLAQPRAHTTNTPNYFMIIKQILKTNNDNVSSC